MTSTGSAMKMDESAMERLERCTHVFNPMTVWEADDRQPGAQVWDAFATDLCALLAENRRLRAALEALVGRDVTYNGAFIDIRCDSHPDAMRVVREARAAIEGAKL